jgi:dolichyl-phosphate-mannose--protein O-mannosyl transferase
VAAVLLFVLTQSVPAILLLVLVVTLYLVWVDVKDEPIEFQVKIWWFLFVLLLHVPGYLVFRVWIAVRRHRRKEEAHPSTPGPRGRRGGGRA